MKRILIIDDDIVIREILKEALEPLGYDLGEASNGREGMTLFKKKPYDLIITDIIMPEMEGLETILTLKRLASDAKIIAISGGGKATPDGYLGMAEKLGAHRIFSKPFDPKDLAASVNHLLGGA